MSLLRTVTEAAELLHQLNSVRVKDCLDIPQTAFVYQINVFDREVRLWVLDTNKSIHLPTYVDVDVDSLALII